ncbi:hypothetical protein THRCLA_00429 [Thraustotheca clavata]|uniref:Uncharacterized protein n=1 Tax=Thraustotheca clavata TaxID=74557 RepID=A0A1W0ABJ5_9STRA|nr:hypothetical protein THRCLA_00429 [Thraustotheca clavata]
MLIKVPIGPLRRAISSIASKEVPWYRQEIAKFAENLELTKATESDFERLVALPQRDDVMYYEIQVHSDSAQDLGTYLPATKKKQIEILWAKTLCVLDQIQDNKLDGYTAAFQALASAEVPYKYMDHLFKRLQGENFVANPMIHIGMLQSARDRGIIQVLRRVKASQMGNLLLDSKHQSPELTPWQVQTIHYRAHASFIKSIYANFMVSSTSKFTLESYQVLYEEMLKLLPPLDDKLMERVVADEFMDKLAVASIRALAMSGSHEAVVERLEQLESEYAGRSAKVPSIVYETALEAISTFCHNLTMISERQLMHRNKEEDVQVAYPVRKIKKIESQLSARHAKTVNKLESNITQLPWADVEKQYTKATNSKEYLKFVQNRVRGASVLESFRLLTREAMVASDEYVKKIREMHAATYPDRSMAMEIGVLKQYFVSASRYERRLKRSHRLQDELVHRIFASLDRIANMKDSVPEAEVVESLHYAFRTMTILYRVSEAKMILDIKREWLPHLEMTVAEYDDLIMLLCTNKKTRPYQPLEILQEMHNRGLKPSRLTLHRLVTFRMMHLSEDPQESSVTNKKQQELATKLQLAIDGKDEETQVNDTEDDQDDQDDQDENDEIEEEKQWDLSLSEQESVGDVITFLQDWYNMTGVVPYGKTIVPMIQYCLRNKSKVKYELDRFVLWLDTLPLDAATKVYVASLAKK